MATNAIKTLESFEKKKTQNKILFFFKYDKQAASPSRALVKEYSQDGVDAMGRRPTSSRPPCLLLDVFFLTRRERSATALFPLSRQDGQHLESWWGIAYLQYYVVAYP